MDGLFENFVSALKFLYLILAFSRQKDFKLDIVIEIGWLFFE